MKPKDALSINRVTNGSARQRRDRHYLGTALSYARRERVVKVALLVTRYGNSAAGQIDDSGQRLVR